MRKGIVVGVSRYTDEKLPDLKFTAADALSFTNALVEFCNFERGNIETLVDNDDGVENDKKIPTFENILAALARQQSTITSEAFVFYFAGHGFRSKDGIDFLIPKRADVAALDGTSIPLSKIIELCGAVNADRTIVIVDACRNVIQGQHIFLSEAGRAPAALFRSSNISLILSSRPGEFSHEADALQAGVFTHTLARLLEPRFNCKTIEQIYDKLRVELPRACSRVGCPEQTPFAFFFPEEAKLWILPISKIRRSLHMPDWLGEEIRPANQIEPTDNAGFTLAIDLGTTKTAAAFIDENGGVQFVADHGDRILMPSTVRLRQDGSYEIGVDHFGAPSARYSKRFLIDKAEHSIDGRQLSAVNALWLIFNSVVSNAEQQTNRRIVKCMIAIPTDFNLLQAAQLISACQARGIVVERCVPEPTAAALNIAELLLERIASAMAARTKLSHSIVGLVVDMGGGTLDVSFVVASAEYLERWRPKAVGIHDVNMEIMASTGDRRLGGIDFNEVMKSIVLSDLREQLGPAWQPNYGEMLDLESQIEAAKLAISEKRNGLVFFEAIYPDGTQRRLPISISARRFNEASRDLIERFEACVDRCIEQGIVWGGSESIFEQTEETLPGGGVRENKVVRVDVVLLAGQAGKSAAVKNRLASKFPKARIIDDFADCAVARGIAIWYGQIYGRNGNLLDICYWYLGISIVHRHENEVVLPAQESRDEARLPIDWIIQPDDRVPCKTGRNVRWVANQNVVLEICSQSIGKKPEKVAVLKPGVLRGTRGRLYIIVDSFQTVVVEVADQSGNSFAWQINNLFRFPHGYKPRDTVSENASESDTEGAATESVRELVPLN